MLAHEAAFALGQMQDVEAIPVLEGILKDLSFHPIVRHEVVYLISITAVLTAVLLKFFSRKSDCATRQLKPLEQLVWGTLFPCWNRVWHLILLRRCKKLVN